MSPNLFAGIVAGTILFGLVAIAALVVLATLSRDPAAAWRIDYCAKQ